MKLRDVSLTNLSSLLIAIISLIITLSIPTLYFVFAYQYIAGSMKTEMTFTARMVEDLVANNPDSWQFEEIRLQEILDRKLDHTNRENRTIRNLQGQVIAEAGEPVVRLSAAFRQPVYDSGIEVARLEFDRSLTPLVLRTAMIGVGSALLGIMTFLLFYFFPVRTLQRAHDQLQQNEQRLALALKSGHFGILDWDIQKDEMIWDDGMYAICGIVRDSREMSIESWQNHVHREDRRKFLEDINPQIIREKGYDTEFRILRPDGTVRHIKADGFVVKDKDGKPMRLICLNHDVTERMQDQEALRKSQEQYTKLVDTIPDALIRTDLEGNINFVNDQTLRISGYRNDEIVGKNILSFIVSEDWNTAIQNSLLMIERKLGPREYRLTMKDGRKVPFEVNGDVLRDEDGKPFGIVNICRDVSDRKQAEDALRESERKYRLLTEKMTDVVWITDLNFRTLYITPSVQTVLGFSPEERIPLDAAEQMTPESLALAIETLTRELAIEAQGLGDPDRTVNLLLEYYHRDGTTRWLDTTIGGFRDDQGVLTELHGVSRDVTARKQAEEAVKKSEEMLHLITENMSDLIRVTDLQGNNLYVSPSHFRGLGYTRDERVGKSAFDIVHPDDIEMIINKYAEGLAAEKRIEVEYRVRHADGHYVWLDTVADLLRNDQGEPKAVVMSSRDVSDRKIMEEERQKLEQQLLQSQKMDAIGQLAGGVAHDFNNMLSVIIGNTEMVINRLTPSDPLRMQMQDIMNAGMRSADLTRQLLAFARRQTVSPKVLDLNDTVSRMLKMLQRLIGENIKLIWKPGQNLWSVRMDPSQIDQLLANLTVNARDAMNKAGKIIIETSNTICDEAYHTVHPEWIPGDYVVLSVSDDGCGMEKETLDNIFEPFFTTKKEGQGTGLGLATVYGIVKQNDGFINVYSEPGMGTTFKIYLPRCGDEILKTAEDHAEIEVQMGSETILIVEDEESVLKLSQDMLEMLGYKVLAARRTDQAFRLVREYDGNIDLLLADIVMPDMNGKELAERIIPLKPGMKCLYMSGYTADVIARQGILDKGIQFISKPFSLRDLSVKIREVLR